MQNLKVSELDRAVKNEILNLYLVAGDDDYLCDAAVKTVLRALEAAGADEPLKFSFGAVNADDLESLTTGVSFFGARRCAVITDVKAGRSLTEAQKEMFKGFFSSLPCDLTVILRYTDTDSFRFSVPKALSDLVGVCRKSAVVSCEVKTINVGTAVSKMIKNAGCTVSDRAVSLLCERCGDDLMLLSTEVEKLAAYANYGEITAAHVEALGVRTPEDNVYDMISALEKGDIKSALSTLEDMIMQRVQPVYISASLNTAFINSYRACLAREGGHSEQWLVENFAYKKGDKKLSIAFSRSSRYSVKQLEKILNCLYELDLKLKSSRVDKNIILERRVAELALLIKTA